jgi:hypothetical protein
MKAAVLIAHFPSGWKTLALGSDLVALKTRFKEIKGASFVQHEGETADLVIFMDTAGNIRRKRLDDPAALEERAGLNALGLAQEEAARTAAAAAAAKADAEAVAAEVAAKAVTLIAETIVAASKDEPPAPAPAPEAEPAEEDPAARFSTSPRKPKGSR